MADKQLEDALRKVRDGTANPKDVEFAFGAVIKKLRGYVKGDSEYTNPWLNLSDESQAEIKKISNLSFSEANIDSLNKVLAFMADKDGTTLSAGVKLSLISKEVYDLISNQQSRDDFVNKAKTAYKGATPVINPNNGGGDKLVVKAPVVKPNNSPDKIDWKFKHQDGGLHESLGLYDAEVAMRDLRENPAENWKKSAGDRLDKIWTAFNVGIQPVRAASYSAYNVMGLPIGTIVGSAIDSVSNYTPDQIRQMRIDWAKTVVDGKDTYGANLGKEDRALIKAYHKLMTGTVQNDNGYWSLAEREKRFSRIYSPEKIVTKIQTPNPNSTSGNPNPPGATTAQTGSTTTTTVPGATTTPTEPGATTTTAETKTLAQQLTGMGEAKVDAGALSLAKAVLGKALPTVAAGLEKFIGEGGGLSGNMAVLSSFLIEPGKFVDFKGNVDSDEFQQSLQQVLKAVSSHPSLGVKYEGKYTPEFGNALLAKLDGMKPEDRDALLTKIMPAELDSKEKREGTIVGFVHMLNTMHVNKFLKEDGNPPGFMKLGELGYMILGFLSSISPALGNFAATMLKRFIPGLEIDPSKVGEQEKLAGSDDPNVVAAFKEKFKQQLGERFPKAYEDLKKLPEFKDLTPAQLQARLEESFLGLVKDAPGMDEEKLQKVQKFIKETVSNPGLIKDGKMDGAIVQSLIDNVSDVCTPPQSVIPQPQDGVKNPQRVNADISDSRREQPSGDELPSNTLRKKPSGEELPQVTNETLRETYRIRRDIGLIKVTNNLVGTAPRIANTIDFKNPRIVVSYWDLETKTIKTEDLSGDLRAYYKNGEVSRNLSEALASYVDKIQSRESTDLKKIYERILGTEKDGKGVGGLAGQIQKQLDAAPTEKPNFLSRHFNPCVRDTRYERGASGGFSLFCGGRKEKMTFKQLIDKLPDEISTLAPRQNQARQTMEQRPTQGQAQKDPATPCPKDDGSCTETPTDVIGQQIKENSSSITQPQNMPVGAIQLQQTLTVGVKP
ncbi:MAG: hypothetical protein ACT4OY_07730 [Alphaproteobacteria bacterium]